MELRNCLSCFLLCLCATLISFCSRLAFFVAFIM
jgi:hypothetical protein